MAGALGEDYKRAYNREYHKNRYSSDPAFRERKRRYARKQCSSPDYKEKRKLWPSKKNDAERLRRWVKYGPQPVSPHSPELARMMDAQGYTCKICDVSFDDTKPQVDHCHKTGVVRGLLCVRCNTGLGKFKDCPDLLARAADYLRR